RSPHIATLPLHDALPILLAPDADGSRRERLGREDVPPDEPRRDLAERVARVGRAAVRLVLDRGEQFQAGFALLHDLGIFGIRERSEEYTSELQSPCNIVC